MPFIDRTVTVFAPASIGNVGSGFDVIGVAIEKPGDIVVASRAKAEGLHFTVKNSRHGVDLPTATAKNVAAHVAQLMLDEFKPHFGISLVLHKHMPVGSGLGSSAASSVAAAVAVNALMTTPLKRAELLPFALEGERLASGSGHADNAAPCLLGGAQLVRSYTPLDVVQLTVKGSITWVVVHPHLTLHTADARHVMPTSIALNSAIQQWGNVAGLVAGLARGDAGLVGRSTEDVVAEPHRAALICGFHEVKHAALEAGAFGCSISGSGPSMFAVTNSPRSARKVAAAMQHAFMMAANTPSDVFVSRTNMRGAVISTHHQRPRR